MWFNHYEKKMSYEVERDCGRNNEHSPMDLVAKIEIFLKPVYILMRKNQGKRFKRPLTIYDWLQTTTSVTSTQMDCHPLFPSIVYIGRLCRPCRSFLSHQQVCLLCFWVVTTNFEWVEWKGRSVAHWTNHPIIHRECFPSTGRQSAHHYLWLKLTRIGGSTIDILAARK